MWPVNFRKKKPYTADELVQSACERDAIKIRNARGSGEIIRIAPDDDAFKMGRVFPPGGGTISEWYWHHAVRDGNRFYDKMTGPEGMPEQEYRLLFEYWHLLIIEEVK
jgi:hypothetical protein